MEGEDFFLEQLRVPKGKNPEDMESMVEKMGSKKKRETGKGLFKTTETYPVVDNIQKQYFTLVKKQEKMDEMVNLLRTFIQKKKNKAAQMVPYEGLISKINVTRERLQRIEKGLEDVKKDVAKGNIPIEVLERKVSNKKGSELWIEKLENEKLEHESGESLNDDTIMQLATSMEEYTETMQEYIEFLDEEIMRLGLQN